MNTTRAGTTLLLVCAMTLGTGVAAGTAQQTAAPDSAGAANPVDDATAPDTATPDTTTPDTDDAAPTTPTPEPAPTEPPSSTPEPTPAPEPEPSLPEPVRPDGASDDAGDGDDVGDGDDDPNDADDWTPQQFTPRSALGIPSTAVVINEIYYHAPDKNPAVEFVEIHNRSAASVLIGRWCFDGIDYCFPAGSTIAANGYRTVRATTYSGSLSNSGERLRLLKPGAIEVDAVAYDDVGQWPAWADGEGHSLQRRDPTLDGSAPGNWMSAPPTPNERNSTRASGLLPMFSNVTFTRSPSSAQSVIVTGNVTNALALVVNYRIGFGAEVGRGVTIKPDGSFRTEIPRQSAGALVRFRFAATRGAVRGIWPRQGDGSDYLGTVVKSARTSPLERFQLFMEPDQYNRAYRDLTLSGDEGYPLVFSYDGEVFDKARIRVKGQSSRSYAKKKWKVSLPAGHEWESPILRAKVDELALHAMVTDKSYSREILSWDVMSAAQQIGQQTIPVRLELNGAFYGLYDYIEQPDSDWRERQGFSDDAIAYEAVFSATLYRGDLALSDGQFDVRYERKTQRYIDSDTELRSLIRNLNTRSGDNLRSWAYQNIDIPQLINSVATMRVLQHYELGHKNYTVVFDPADGKWRWIPQDFDLNLGHYWSSRCGSLCDPLRIISNLNYPSYNFLARVVIVDPVFRKMLDQRTRTLTDEFLATRVLNKRLGELNQTMLDDSERDRAKWGSWGQRQSMTTAQNLILQQFIIPKGRGFRSALPITLTAAPNVTITRLIHLGSKELIEVSNASNSHVDISGWTIREAGVVIPGGVVLAPGMRVVLIRQNTSREDLDNAGVLALPIIPGGLSDQGGAFYLRTADGLMTSGRQVGAPPAKTVIVNEYNSTDPDKVLKGGAVDPAFGPAPGNGGNWFELVVVSDHVDLRGWTIVVTDDTGGVGQTTATVTVPGDGTLADLRSGTIVTFSDTLATNLSLNAAAGDWSLNLKATFSTSKTNTQLTVKNASGAVVSGPVGEGVVPASGVGSDEVFQLRETPVDGSTPTAYSDGNLSTFGQPNVWSDGAQDLTVLRSVSGPPLPDGGAPTKPTGVTLSNVTSAGALVRWTPSTDTRNAVSYAVAIDGHVVATTKNRWVNLTILFPRTTYRLEIFAVDASGMRSPTSGPITLTTESGTVNLGS